MEQLSINVDLIINKQCRKKKNKELSKRYLSVIQIDCKLSFTLKVYPSENVLFYEQFYNIFMRKIKKKNDFLNR